MRPARNRKVYEVEGVRSSAASVRPPDRGMSHRRRVERAPKKARSTWAAISPRAAPAPPPPSATGSTPRTTSRSPARDSRRSSAAPPTAATTTNRAFSTTCRHDTRRPGLFSRRRPQASDVLIFWEYSTSTAEARRVAEQAFWSLIAATAPSDFEDVFSFDEAAGVRYGYRAGRPWVVTVAALPARKGSPGLPSPPPRIASRESSRSPPGFADWSPRPTSALLGVA